MVAAMIERDFNRASVVFWIAGTGEEIADVTDYFPSVRAVAKSIDPHRPIGFAFDDAAKTPEDVLANLEIARSTGMDFLAQVGYWDESSIDAVVAALPEDFPVLIAEWTGSEGSERGPIGLPGMTGFPEVPDPEGTGVFCESFQVSSMLGAALPWFPHLLNGPPPIAGLVYFNWQDLDSIGAAHLFLGHGPALRSGRVYEDRKPKLAFSAFQLVMDVFSGIDAEPPTRTGPAQVAEPVPERALGGDQAERRRPRAAMPAMPLARSISVPGSGTGTTLNTALNDAASPGESVNSTCIAMKAAAAPAKSSGPKLAGPQAAESKAPAAKACGGSSNVRTGAPSMMAM